MKHALKCSETVTRLVLPYKDIFTTVYVLQAPEGIVVFDTATTVSDMEDHLLPLLEELGIDGQQVRAIVISHNHRDHAGGLERLLQALPHGKVYSRCPRLQAQFPERVHGPEDGELLLDAYRFVTIPGHTLDSMALLELKSNTLITGDCLQLYGIYGSGEWGANITFPAEHLQALKKVRELEPEAIYCAHDYHPCGWKAKGREEIGRMLDACAEPLLQLRDLICANPALDDTAIRDRYQASAHLPKVPLKVVAALRKALAEGAIVDA